jgi:hemerythrin
VTVKVDVVYSIGCLKQYIHNIKQLIKVDKMGKEKIVWSDDLSTGIEWQDEQHKKWIQNMADLYDSVKNFDSSIDQFQTVVKFLDDYIVYHFTAEESAMEKAHYPHIEIHKQQHEKFRKQFEEFKQYTVGESVVDSAALCYDMSEWVLNHIATVDKDMADFIRGEINEDLV